MRIFSAIIFVLILSTPCLAQKQVEVYSGDELHIRIFSDNQDPRQMEMLLCSGGCVPLEAKSVSYNGREVDIFAEPEEPGVYDLKIFLGEEFYEEKVNVTQGHRKPQENIAGITSNIVGNASSPVFFLGIIGIFALYLFLVRRDVLKTKLLRPFAGEIKFLYVFALSFLVLSPFTHEFFHITMAGLFSCQAVLESFVPVFTPTSVSLNCEISSLRSIIVLAAGLAGNLALGLIFFALASRKKSSYMYPVSLAFIWSSFFYLFYTTGDLHSIMGIMGVALPQLYLNLSGAALISASFYVFFRRLRR